jgi:hypothetical protein
MGILPLERPSGDDGQIQDLVMICPVCKDEFRATGMRWLGAFKVAIMSDAELDAWAEHIVDVLSADAIAHGFAQGRTSAPEDPFGAGEERDLS